MFRNDGVATELVATLLSLCIVSCAFAGSASAGAPPIRLSATNQVPACVTPSALNRFLADQNRLRKNRLLPQFRGIARHYQRHGLRHRVRWDYAFFQMALETNFLSFRRGNGKRGDVHPKQNNFAGLGTTGGGVPGDRYPNVSTGVLAQIQHLVVYSGERLANPVGHRTRLKQNVILQSIAPVVRRRPVTFADLARRWAADRHYGRSIQRLAGLFYGRYCNASAAPSARRAAPSPAPLPLRQKQISKTAKLKRVPQKKKPPRTKKPRPVAKLKPPVPGKRAAAPTKSCEVQVASYGGSSAVLIRSENKGAVKLIALTVQPGFEAAMAANFIRSYAPKGQKIGDYPSSKEALAKAHALCRGSS